MRSLTLHEHIHINNLLEKSYALIYALTKLAENDLLEEFGDEDASILLDEAVCGIKDAQELLGEGVEKAA